MKKIILYSLTLMAISLCACKKESVSEPKPKTNQEKILGKWNEISEVTNNYYNGTPHITTYTLQAGSYMEFKAGGKVTEYNSGSTFIYDYGFIDESNIWLGFIDNKYHLNTLTESDLQLYKKDVSGADYYESTLNLKK